MWFTIVLYDCCLSGCTNMILVSDVINVRLYDNQGTLRDNKHKFYIINPWHIWQRWAALFLSESNAHTGLKWWVRFHWHGAKGAFLVYFSESWGSHSWVHRNKFKNTRSAPLQWTCTVAKKSQALILIMACYEKWRRFDGHHRSDTAGLSTESSDTVGEQVKLMTKDFRF